MIVNAQIKLQKHFPPAEFCCAEALEMQASYYGRRVKVDLSDIAPWTSLGHCRQELGYARAVMVVSDTGDKLGYTPFELLDIDEGPGDVQ